MAFNIGPTGPARNTRIQPRGQASAPPPRKSYTPDKSADFKASAATARGTSSTIPATPSTKQNGGTQQYGSARPHPR